jgi:FtsH-binding integral membrane protein
MPREVSVNVRKLIAQSRAVSFALSGVLWFVIEVLIWRAGPQYSRQDATWFAWVCAAAALGLCIWKDKKIRSFTVLMVLIHLVIGAVAFLQGFVLMTATWDTGDIR